MVRYCSCLFLFLGLARGADVLVLHAGISPFFQPEITARNVLLGRVTTWGEGGPAANLVFVRHASGQLAIRSFLGRDLNRLLAGWKRLVFTGNGSMPLIVDTPEEALRLIAAKPGSGTLLQEAPDPLPPGLRIVVLVQPPDLP
jgi:hypothetical protein